MNKITSAYLFALTTLSMSSALAVDPPVHDANPKIELEITSVTESFCVGEENCDWIVSCAAAPVGGSTNPNNRPRRSLVAETDEVDRDGNINLRNPAYSPFSGRLPINVFSVSDLPLELTCRVQEIDGFLRGEGIDQIKTVRVERCGNLPNLSVRLRSEGELRINYKVRARPRMLMLWHSPARGDYQVNTSAINPNHNAHLRGLGFSAVSKLGWISHPKCLSSRERPLYNWYSRDRSDNVASTSSTTGQTVENWNPAAYPNNIKTMPDGSTYKFIDILGGIIKAELDWDSYQNSEIYHNLLLWHKTERSVPMNRRDYRLSTGPVTAPSRMGDYVRERNSAGYNISFQGRILSPRFSIEQAVNRPPYVPPPAPVRP